MRITLKNGETVKLDWNWLVVEYIDKELEDFDNFAKIMELEKKDDIKAEDILGLGLMDAFGTLCYAIVQANIDEEYTRRQLIRLLEFEDMVKIIEFMFENEEKILGAVGIKK